MPGNYRLILGTEWNIPVGRFRNSLCQEIIFINFVQRGTDMLSHTSTGVNIEFLKMKVILRGEKNNENDIKTL